MLPWIGYNLSRFNQPVLLTSGSGILLSAANCDETYAGADLGYWRNECYTHRGRPMPPEDVSDVERDLRHAARDYAFEHRDRWPGVIGRDSARCGATSNRRASSSSTIVSRRGELPAAWTGLLMFYALVPLAVFGAAVLRRHRVPLAPLLAWPITVSIAAVLAFGQTRYRGLPK